MIGGARIPQLPDRRGPNCEQNLLIGPSKHLYFLKDGALKYQRKDLDPRTCGNKQLITRFVILDVGTGTVYGECHMADTAGDLIGFLARAWSIKANHPMRGIPALLNVPRIAYSNDAFRADLELIRSATGLSLGELPSGFSAGIHAVRQFEREVESLIWRAELVGGGAKADIDMVTACSAHLSVAASNTLSDLWNPQWEKIAPPPQAFFDAVESCYPTAGAWKSGYYESILAGLTHSKGSAAGN